MPLALALLVPVNMIQGLMQEREAWRNEAVASIAEGWGSRQTLAGPYLVVPYERPVTLWCSITCSAERAAA